MRGGGGRILANRFESVSRRHSFTRCRLGSRALKLSSQSEISHWYPSRSEIDAIERSLSSFRATIEQTPDPNKEFAVISRDLLNWLLVPQFPRHLTKRWLWLASLLRRPISDEVKGDVAAAILYFNRATTPEHLSNGAEVRKLRWVIDSISEQVSRQTGCKSHSLIDDSDAHRIEQQIKSLLSSKIDLESISGAIAERTKTLRELCGPWCFPSMLSKVGTLIEVAKEQNSERARVATAALAYFASDDDAVPDKMGVLGLIDDAYVIEWAFAAVTGTTLQLPVLESAIERWSFLDDLIFLDDQGLIGFDRYVSYLIGMVLFSIFELKQQLVLAREGGPTALLAAICVAVAWQRDAAALKPSKGLETGTPIFIGDDISVFRAVYKRQETITGRKKHWIAVAQDGSITIDDTALQFTRIAPDGHHKPLSKGNVISQWLEERHPSALTFIANQQQTPGLGTTAVLLLTQRRRLDGALSDLRPFGLDLAKLVDIRYVSSTGDTRHYHSAAASVPPVYVVSDADAAMELLLQQSQQLAQWLVVVDGADAAVRLYGAMKTSPTVAETPICVVAEWHEREQCSTLIGLGMLASCLDFADVEVAPDTETRESTKGSALRKYIRRGQLSSKATISHHPIRNPGFELLDEAIRKLSRTQEDSLGTSLDRLVINVVAFMKKATGYPIAFESALKSELLDLATKLRSEASANRLFSPEAQSIFDVFDLLVTENELCPDRTPVLQGVTQAFAADERIAVVCRSAVVASACTAHCAEDPVLGRLRWMSTEQLREQAPFDRLIVATWLGRSIMREICDSGFAREVHFILFPYERDLLHSTTRAATSWRRRITLGANTGLATLAAKTRQAGSVWSTWSPVGAPHDDGATVPEIEEQQSETDAIEARVISAIKNGPVFEATKDRTVKARLVLFEETGAFAYLTPEGKNIALSALTHVELGHSTDAERLLFRKTDSLRPGMVVAFATTTSRDLVDARADQFLVNHAVVRRQAAKWKEAVRRFILANASSYERFADLLATVGVSREPSTIQRWVLGHDTVGPRNHAEVIPKIAQITMDGDLSKSMAQTIRAVEQIYAARSRAAGEIVRDLFAGEIDLDADSIDFTIDDQLVRYELHRVRSVEPKAVTVPFDLIGRVLRYQDAVSISPASAQ